MSPAPHPSRRFGLTWLWVLVPLLTTLWLSWKWTPNFPHADHWGIEADLLIADAEGKVSWELLAKQINDSRYVLARLCYLLVGTATHWNVQIEAAICVLMAGGNAILAWWMARRTLPGRTADVAGAIMSLLILTPHQVMNWNFGVQICYFLVVGAAVGIAAVFMSHTTLVRQTVWGIVLATVGTWSFAPGWVAWGLVIWGILGWLGRTRNSAVGVALLATVGAVGVNLLIYFNGYQFLEEIPLTQKVVVKTSAMARYFLDLLGAGFAEGWPQNRLAARAGFLNVLAPCMAVFVLLWLGLLAVLHRRDLQRRTGKSPAWMWVGLTGWAVLVVGLVSLARTGNVLSHAFASRYLAFSIWAWAGAAILTLLLPAGKVRKGFLIIGFAVMLWGWCTGVLAGIKYLQRDGYTMRLLQGTLTMSLVAPEPQGLRSNDPNMHLWLPVADRLDTMGYLHPRLVHSPLVSDANVTESATVSGEITSITPGPPLRVSGYAIDHGKGGPVDCVVLSYQEPGGEEIWWTPVTGRSVDRPYKVIARQHGFEGEHARIGWEWVSGMDAGPYAVVSLPTRPCVIRAYAFDGGTGTFHRLQGELDFPPVK